MLRTLTRRAAAASALALAVTLVGPAPSVSAAYNGVCGNGYGVVNQATISGGTIYLTYNSTNGNNCVVVVRSNSGAAMNMDAALKASDGTSWQTDPGDWTQYAGPVYLDSMAGQCVDWGGAIGDEWVLRNGTNCGG